jgi:hypothetical protein
MINQGTTLEPVEADERAGHQHEREPLNRPESRSQRTCSRRQQLSHDSE